MTSDQATILYFSLLRQKGQTNYELLICIYLYICIHKVLISIDNKLQNNTIIIIIIMMMKIISIIRYSVYFLLMNCTEEPCKNKMANGKRWEWKSFNCWESLGMRRSRPDGNRCHCYFHSIDDYIHVCIFN